MAKSRAASALLEKVAGGGPTKLTRIEVTSLQIWGHPVIAVEQAYVAGAFIDSDSPL